MYLKSLVLQGFKSFAQRVELLFPHGVTAIVGPNGSGKSNVSDAVRWVLGEQNIRSLRGAALQDVIFAGTHGRKPLGMAEVSLTLDNSDFTLPLEYAEITITRRTYRSGESEFYINRTPCRLRDIQDLLMDTGLGRGTLSIIGQGEIDAILSVRPEERRALLEEVAGITRYRSKRRAALERLAATEQDLMRVNDITSEVERQLTPLAREAERASRYNELNTALVSLEKQLVLHDWGIRKEAWQGWQSRHIEATSLWQVAKDELSVVQIQRKEANEEVHRMQGLVTEEQAALAELERRAQQFDARVRVLDERLIGFRADEERRVKGLDTLAEGHAQHVEASLELTKRRSLLEASVHEAQARMATAEQRVVEHRKLIESGEATLQSLRSASLAHVQKAADAQSELRRTETATLETTGSLRLHEERLREHKQRLAAAQAERERAQTHIAELDETRTNLVELHASVSRSLADLESSRTTLAESMEALRGRLAGVRSQRDALRDLDASFEGFHEGVRACLQAEAPWRTGIFGAVGTLLDVRTDHEIALETALGAATQNIVVADEETAKSAIEYLKRNRAGRVTFLPLDALRVSPPIIPDSWLLDDEEYIGIASQLVRFDPAIQRAVEYLLGRVMVTRTLAGAIRLNRRQAQVSRVVSLEGDLVLAAGPITGGQGRRRQGSGLLTRSRRLAELSSLAQQLAAELEDKTVQRQQLAASIDQAHAERADIDGRLQSVLKEMSEHQRVVDVLRERLHALDHEVQRIEADIVQSNATLQRLQEEQAEVSLQLGSLDTDKERQQSEVEQLEQKLAELRKDQAALEDERAECRAAWAESVAQLNGLDIEVQRTQSALESFAQSRATEEGELKTVQERIVLTEHERADAQAQGDSCRAQATAKGEDLAQVRVQLESTQSTAEEWSHKEDAARARIEEASGALHKIELALERERVAYVQMEERLIELEIDIPVDPRATQLPDVDPLRHEAKRLRHRLEELGSVNVNALEEYSALKERHAFLISQRNDLVEAKAGLDKAIADMDATSRERLQSTFRAVQDSLSQVFPRLFGGGKAELHWTDQDDPLESGLEMLVQPPGKRPQPLLTLSGGERALAAASLLFSIMTVRPSPFFVLDEVDAALDEANVERFAQLLQEYGKRNQIVVITHRQGTMERADALFGVTMERQGSSQLVSLRLDDALATAP